MRVRPRSRIAHDIFHNGRYKPHTLYLIQEAETNKYYNNLRNAVVIQAASDYREVCKKLKTHLREKDRQKLEIDKQNIEVFFQDSDWFAFWCDLDGKEILRRLQEELK